MIHIAKGVITSNAAPVSMPGGKPNIKTENARNNITVADKRLIHLPGRFTVFSSVFDKITAHCHLTLTELNQPYYKSTQE